MTKWTPPLPDKYPGEVKQWMLDYAEQYRRAWVESDEIRRAIAIAQAVDEWFSLADTVVRFDERSLLTTIMRRADELLEGK